MGVGGCGVRWVLGQRPRVSPFGELEAARDAAEQFSFGAPAAKAMRIRVAVSVMRAAILSRRIRRVVNSAVASG
jgi:hypothetical protein